MVHPAQSGEGPALRRIGEILLRRRGLDLSGYKAHVVGRRIWTRVRALRLADLEAYAERLASDDDEADELLAAVTINVSAFFRNPALFQMLERDVLPGLLASRRGRPVDVWCAGCAAGEEVYSLAILFRRLAAGRARPASILGTDIDRRALAEAEAGLYPRDRLREVPPAERLSLFVEEGERLRVGPVLRGMCRFETANLLRDAPPQGVDLVLCRNLLIFLEEPEQRRVLDVLRRALRRGGLLVLGAVERVPASHAEAFEPLDRTHRVYRRLDAPDGGEER